MPSKRGASGLMNQLALPLVSLAAVVIWREYPARSEGFGDKDMDAGSERAWKLEIRRRRRQIREGKTKLIPADEVMSSALRSIS